MPKLVEMKEEEEIQQFKIDFQRMERAYNDRVSPMKQNLKTASSTIPQQNTVQRSMPMTPVSP